MSETAPMNITSRLKLAQTAIKFVVEGGEVAGGGAQYRFASSEDIIADCRKVLHDAGLVVTRCGSRLLPQSSMLPKSKPDRPDRPWCVVQVDFLLESVLERDTRSYTIELPAIEGGGQSMDKKVLGCLTSATGYFLVGLLMLPRFDEHEISRRKDDSPAQEPETIGDADAEKIRSQIAAAGLTLEGLLEHANARLAEKKRQPMPGNLADWPKRAVPNVMTWIEQNRKKGTDASSKR